MISLVCHEYLLTYTIDMTTDLFFNYLLVVLKLSNNFIIKYKSTKVVCLTTDK